MGGRSGNESLWTRLVPLLPSMSPALQRQSLEVLLEHVMLGIGDWV
ncbi:MAG: hypothetical protein GDA56_01870 [Hormoscilla sp. GM7CHS1pb]|nr:hypothetical protein [Hormoscilla sp. GM7CHS1pb]